MSLGGYGEVFFRNVALSGVVPQLSLILGPCAGGAVYSPAITDFVIMARGTAQMFITGPDVIRAVTGEEVTFDQLGGAETHASISGVSHLTARSDADALALARRLLSYLPLNNLEEPPTAPRSAPPDSVAGELVRIVPEDSNLPYDVHGVIERIVDVDTFFEIHAAWAPNIVVGFARLDGRPIGVVANNPASLAGTLDIPGLGEGRPLRAVLRRVQPPARDLRRRPGVPARHGPGVRRDHSPRGETALRLRRGDRPAAHRDPSQGLRGRVRRHVFEAPRGRPEPRLADRRDRGHGGGGGGQHPLSQGDRRSRPSRSGRPSAPSASPSTGPSSSTHTSRPNGGTSTT